LEQTARIFGSTFDLTPIKRINAIDRIDRHVQIAVMVIVVMTVYAALGYHAFMAFFAGYLVLAFGFTVLLYLLPQTVGAATFWSVQAYGFALNLVWIAGVMLLWLSNNDLLRFGGVIGLFVLMMNAWTSRRDIPHLAYSDALAVLIGAACLPLGSYFIRGDTIEAVVVATTLGVMTLSFLLRLRLSQRRRIAVAHETQVAAIKERMLALGRLTGGVAHDFNNMLTVISGNLELIQHTNDPFKRTELITQAHDASQRASQITGHLLAFSRQAVLRPRAVHPLDCIEGVVKMLDHLMPSNVSFDVEIMPDMPVFVVDTSQLETAIVGLCLNARDAMPHGGKLDLLVAAYNPSVQGYDVGGTTLTEGRYIKFCVADTGIGIPSDVLESVWEPYFSTKSLDQASGLGLAMAKGFVEQSGGAISIESTIDVGTRVSLFFPVPSVD